MLSIIEKDKKKIALFTLTGDPLGESDAELVRQKMRLVVDSKIPHVIFEMKGVRHINSAGLGGLVMANVTMAKAGGTIQFTDIGVNVMKVLKMTRLDTVLEIVPTADEAITQWTNDQE